MNRIKASYENGRCPDCQANIPDNVVDGEACLNCGHVFYEEVKELFFTCPQCGKHDLGSVEQVLMTYPIKKINSDGDLDYDTDNATAGDGQVVAYQCMNCGYELKDTENGQQIEDCMKVPEWVEKHCEQE